MKQFGLLLLILSLSACSLFTPNRFESNHRTPGAKIDDNIIVSNIKLLMKKQKFDKNNHINITSFNGVVLSTGEIVSKEAQEKLAEIVKSIYPVRKLHDQTRVIAPSSLTARASDGLITAHITAKLLGDPLARKAEVEIVTENGVAYLMGIVSKDQADKIVHITKSVSGVQRIVKLFEMR